MGISEAKQTQKKTKHQYYVFRRYDILQCGDVKVIRKMAPTEETPKYFVPLDNISDVIKRAHMSTGHGSRDKMCKELSKKYANITESSVELFKSMCI